MSQHLGLICCASFVHFGVMLCRVAPCIGRTFHCLKLHFTEVWEGADGSFLLVNTVHGVFGRGLWQGIAMNFRAVCVSSYAAVVVTLECIALHFRGRIALHFRGDTLHCPVEIGGARDTVALQWVAFSSNGGRTSGRRGSTALHCSLCLAFHGLCVALHTLHLRIGRRDIVLHFIAFHGLCVAVLHLRIGKRVGGSMYCTTLHMRIGRRNIMLQCCIWGLVGGSLCCSTLHLRIGRRLGGGSAGGVISSAGGSWPRLPTTVSTLSQTAANTNTHTKTNTNTNVAAGLLNVYLHTIA